MSRFSSLNEFAWLAELVHKHGDDIDAMVRDRHLNIWQKTAGEIRRAYVPALTQTPQGGRHRQRTH